MDRLFTGENARRYYEARLPNERWTDRAEVPIHCPFHDDRRTSASVKLTDGWHLVLPRRICKMQRQRHREVQPQHGQKLAIRSACGKKRGLRCAAPKARRR